MKLTFFGAAGEVTGSCTLIETGRARVLVDFGLHQGGVTSEVRNHRIPPFDAPRLDAVLLTHAHIDHIGRLPLLPGMGFNGPIHATAATCDFCPIMLEDSARVQDSDVERNNRRRARQGKPPVAALYADADVARVLPLLTPVRYNEKREVAPGVTAKWVDAGHMLGSASIQLTVEDQGSTKIVVFSGDIGPIGAAMLRDPIMLRHADAVVMESTYGDRNHRSLDQTVAEFGDVIREAVWAKERILIPAFAVGRSQQMIYYLGELARTGRVPRFPIYLDSPMAIKAMALYKKYQSHMDAETARLIEEGTNPLFIPDLRCTSSSAESKQLNDIQGCFVVVAASGMCNGGRILHHLRHGLWRRDAHVVIAGFQAAGSLGRRIVDGANKVRISGEWIAVRAKVHTLGGFSAHAGQGELLEWAKNFVDGGVPRFVLNHGEAKARGVLRGLIESTIMAKVDSPEWGQSIEL